MFRFFFALVVLTLSASLVGCNTNGILTPVPHFDWLDEEESETQSIMQSLAISISRMEDATVRDLSPDERRYAVDVQLEIIEELSELLAFDSSSAVMESASTRSHQVVNDHIDVFLAQVQQARRQLLKNPPNYFIAGKLAGHCQVCHQHRDSEAK